jgi:hypothetical protein
MITTMNFVPVTGSTIVLNTDPPGYPIHEYDPSIQDRVDTSRNKSQKQGVWPTFPYEGGMEIRIAGDIYGTSSSDYNDRRQALVNAFRRSGGPTVRKHGTFVVRYDGETEDWVTDVVVTGFSAPRDADSWARSPFSVVLFSWTPYFIGGTTPSNIYYDA